VCWAQWSGQTHAFFVGRLGLTDYVHQFGAAIHKLAAAFRWVVGLLRNARLVGTRSESNFGSFVLALRLDRDRSGWRGLGHHVRSMPWAGQCITSCVAWLRGIRARDVHVPLTPEALLNRSVATFTRPLFGFLEGVGTRRGRLECAVHCVALRVRPFLGKGSTDRQRE